MDSLSSCISNEDTEIEASKSSPDAKYLALINQHRQAEEALRLADQRKDEFLAMLAHELRNPMATIRSGLQILKIVDAKDETSSNTVEMMNRQTDHLVRMIDDLLDVGRIGQGKIELHMRRVNLVEQIRQAAQSVAPLFREQGRTLHLSLPERPVELEGDPTRLTQIAINLLTNGVRYTKEKGEVWVQLEHRNNEAVLRIRDNGIGLSPEHLTSIFDLFVQADNSLGRTKGGLGLGLTLVKRLVEMHGGSVEAQSDGLGKGSTFVTHLPTLNSASEPASSVSTQVSDTISDRRILVIDDNPDVAQTMGMILKLNKFNVQTCNSGTQGIDAAAGFRPKVILLDIGMPGMDGYETCRRLRQTDWGKNVAIVALSGYAQEEDKRRTLEAGFDAHLAKPVDFQVLTTLLDEIAGKS